MADNILKLRVESSDYDAKLKKAAEGIRHLADVAHQSGGELTGLEKAELDYVKALGSMETKSRTAAGSVRELESTYKELTVVYNHLSDAEKQDEGGKALRASLDQIKQRAREGKNELESINQELGNTKTSVIDAKSVIQELGSRFGVSSELLGSLTTGTVAYTAAIGAAATAVAAATKQWADYNAELARQDQVTTVTTGLKGNDAERMTSSMRALSRTYDVDFRDAVNAANTLMTQFGKSGDEAIQLLRDGMQGMIQGDGPKLLSMIQQYAPAFRDAGVSASQLIAVIQNSEGGIFTDQNMNAIVMGIKNIRLMTKATSDALAQLGIDGNKMSKQLSDGSLTIFDALKQVATAIQGVDSNSKAAGEVMQQVFGRQGAMAGTKLGEAISTLNTDLEQTKKQTGEVGESFVKLQQANERLEVAIRECFGYDGYQQLAQGIKTQLVTALASTLELTMKIKDSWAGDVAGGLFEKMTDAALRLMGPLGGVLATLKEIAGIGGNGGGGTTPSNPEVDKMLKYIGEGGTRQERQRRYGRQISSINRQIDSLGQERTRVDADGSTSYYRLSPAKQKQYREALERQKADLQRRATSVIIGSQQESPSAPVINPINTDKPAKKTKTEKEQTELQENQSKINTLTQQYVDINAEASRAGKPLTEEQKKQTEEIHKQIEALKQRNALLNKFAEQAQGRLLSNDDIKRNAETDMQVNTKQIEDLRRQLAEIEQSTATVNVDATHSPDFLSFSKGTAKPREAGGIGISPKTVTITATDEALPKLREIEGITIDDKTMTVTAETADALRALQGIEGVTIDPKSVTITATDEALPKLRDIQGVTIDDKTMTVTAETTDALRALQGIEGVTIDPKTVTITATDEVLPKLREIQGVTIDDKTMTVTAETSDALRALQGIEGVNIDPKSVTITATDEALPKLREIQGITIDDKTMTVTAETADALRALQGIEGVTIDPKTIEVNANTSEAQQKIDDLKAKIAELEDKNINIKAFIESIEKPFEGLNKTPGTLLKAPTASVYENGVMTERAVPKGGLQLDDKTMKAVQKNIDDSLPKAEKKESPMEGGKKMLNAISQLTGGLQQMGIELPSEIQGVIGVIQGAMQVIEAVNTIIGVTQTSALTANTAAMISLEAALWANTSVSWIPFANGGVVPGFANGGVIDSGHSPAFLSFSKAAPAFATGGVVPQTITSIPKFATGGVVPQTITSIPKFATGGIIQKFATGGTVEAGHAPDFLSFSKAMPKFATGGTIPHANSGYFVGGTHFSGDVTPIMANAGELVLNKAQQGNLANQLQGGGMGDLNLTATIKGEQIRLALNNNGRRTGRGEYVQSRNVR